VRLRPAYDTPMIPGLAPLDIIAGVEIFYQLSYTWHFTDSLLGIIAGLSLAGSLHNNVTCLA
jgi:hypothetical protein